MDKMKVMKWSEVPAEDRGGGFNMQAFLTEKMLIYRNTIKAGWHVDPHRHEELIQFVLKGKLKFTSGKEEKILGPEEFIWVPENVEHRVDILEDCLVFDVFSPPRKDYLQEKAIKK